MRQTVFQIVKQIPPGKLMTYKQIGELIGKPNAARAIGRILSTNYDPQIPCHRVISSNGQLSGYNRGLEQKAIILEAEGINLNSPLNHLIASNQINATYKTTS